MVLRKTCWGGLVAVLALFIGCGGGGGNNDQGIVFRATGIFRALTSISGGIVTCTEPVTTTQAITDSAGTVSLSQTPKYPSRDPGALADPCGGYIGLQNNLANQSFNAQFISIRYEVPGSAVQVPENPYNIGITVPPASCKGCTSSGLDGLLYVPLTEQLVPAINMDFLNQFQNELPAPPYQMNVFLTVTGQSDTGTNYTSNEIGYTITVVE